MKGDLEVDGRKYGLVLDIGGYYKNVVTLAPSLHITKHEMDLALKLLDRVMQRVARRERRCGVMQALPAKSGTRAPLSCFARRETFQDFKKPTKSQEQGNTPVRATDVALVPAELARTPQNKPAER